jgi:hypothetical protein
MILDPRRIDPSTARLTLKAIAGGKSVCALASASGVLSSEGEYPWSYLLDLLAVPAGMPVAAAGRREIC